MSYEQLDLIADLYIPLLLLLTLECLFKCSQRDGYKVAFGQMLSLSMSILFIYTIMLIDLSLNIWPNLGLDYSTHTALALCFVVFLIQKGRRWFLFSITSLFAYCALMRYQNYHSVSDMLTTAIVVLPVLLWITIKSAQRAFKNKEAISHSIEC